MTDQTPAQAEGAENAPIEETKIETPAEAEAEEKSEAGESEAEKPKEEPKQPEAEKPKTEKTPEQKERDRLAYQARKAEQERQKALEEAADLRRKLAEIEQSKNQPPKLEEFETHEDWVKAYVDWDKKQVSTTKETQQPPPNPVAMDFYNKEQVIKRAAPDYDQVTRQFADVIDTVPDVSRAVAVFAVQETANAPEFIYELSKDPDFVYELVNTPVYRVGEKLQGRLSEIQARKQPKKQVPSSEPPNAVKPRGKGGKSEEEMSGRELLKKHGLK